MIGTFIGNYRVIARIGEGGMGVVYLAEHPEIGRQLAVKVLHPRLVSDPQNRSRFLNEARAAAAIRHPNIVDVIDVGVLPTDGTPYIVMEHLVGEDLAARLHRRGTLSVPEAIDITQQTAAALGAAHARGIIHRDLKPANLFIVADEAHPGHERIKVLDFGVAKLQGAIAGDVRTQSGVFLGTPTYMSPEQCLGNRDVDQRSDLYALGVILYEMLCGVPPFVSSGLGELVVMHTTQAPAAPRSHNAAIPESLEHVLARLLAKEPSQRFASAAELRSALAALPPAGPRAGSPSWAAAPPGAFAPTGAFVPPGSASAGATPPAPSAHAPSAHGPPHGVSPDAPATVPQDPAAHGPGTPHGTGSASHDPRHAAHAETSEGSPAPAAGSPGVTRAMQNSVIAALPVAERPAARRSRAGLWGFLAGASLAAVAAVAFIVTRSTTPAPPAGGDAAVADVHPNDATIEAERPGSGTHATDAGRPLHPVDASPRPIDPRPRPVDAGPPHPIDAAHPVDAARSIDAASPPPIDAAPPPPPVDAAPPPPLDAAPAPADAAVHPVDAGRPPDAGHPPADAGTPPVDAGRPPPDARPRPDAGIPPDAGSVPPKIAEACTRSCRKLRSCGLRPSASCEQSCASSPKVSACALAAADDCNAAASCELVGSCNGEGPSGGATCNATFACALRCGSQAACACHCTQLLAPQHATAWLKLQRCVTTCRRDPACVQRSCSRFILACQAE